MRKIIRITGQIGVGKSSLMRILRSLFTDAVFIDTDSIAKEIIKNDAQVRQKLSTCLGCMYDHENEDHTARLRQIFFENNAFKKQIEDIVHPLVYAEIEKIIRNRNGSGHIFIESALLYSNRANFFDATISVICSNKELHIQRILEHRTHLSKQEVHAILSQQPSVVEYIQKSDFVIDTAYSEKAHIFDVSLCVEWIDYVLVQKQKWAVFSGSFLPFTKGHESVVEQYLHIFDRIFVMQAFNPEKDHLRGKYSIDEKLLPDHMKGRVFFIKPQQKMTAHMIKEFGTRIQIRGVRDDQDMIYEQKIYKFNHIIDKDIITLFVFAHPKYESISSSLARQVESLDSVFRDIVPPYVKIEGS